MLLFMALLICWGSAAAEESADRVKFAAPSLGRLGLVNYATPKGSYVYGEATSSRAATPAFVIGGASRSDYEFFSYQEEEALWLLMQERIQGAMPLKTEIPALKRKVMVIADFKWPRVIAREGQICVPAVEKSDSPDWADHLICTEVKKDD